MDGQNFQQISKGLEIGKGCEELPGAGDDWVGDGMSSPKGCASANTGCSHRSLIVASELGSAKNWRTTNVHCGSWSINALNWQRCASLCVYSTCCVGWMCCAGGSARNYIFLGFFG